MNTLKQILCYSQIYYQNIDEIHKKNINLLETLTRSISLFLVFYCSVMIGFDVIFNKITRATTIYSVIQIAVSMLFFFFAKFYIRKNQKLITPFSLVYILQLVLFLDMNNMFFNDFISYTVIICVVVITSISFIGPFYYYFTVVIIAYSINFLSVVCFRGPVGITIYQTALYIFDISLIVIITSLLNTFYSFMRCKEIDQKKKIIDLGNKDSLTMLYNRRACEEIISKYNDSSKNDICAMILLDLDNFKAVNDNLGHLSGDELLIDFANDLKDIFADSPCISRIGGDEFMIFFPHISNLSSIEKQVRRILDSFPVRYTTEQNKDIFVSCSIGLVISEISHQDLYKYMYRHADVALYEAKHKGKVQAVVMNLIDGQNFGIFA